jgi:hypothetical protein
MNGILNEITAIQQWQEAGGGFPYDATFSSTNNGYPRGAVVQSSSGNGYWLSLVDNNTTNPDTTTTTTNWVPYNFYGALNLPITSTNVTLTNLQASNPVIYFTGTLTADTTITLPPWISTRVLNNQMTGAFKLYVKTTASASSLYSLLFNTPIQFYCDGTSLIPTTFLRAQLDPYGYQQLPNGFIFQWGKAQTTGELTNIYFPIPFPNAVVSITANDYGAGCNSVSAIPVNNSYFQGAGIAPGSTTYSSTLLQWFAVGY